MTTKELVQTAMMTTLLIVLGFIPGIPLGFIPVPIVLQNLGVMLAGMMLGGKRGTLSILLMFLVGLVLPVFSGKSTTIPVLMGPTAGYVIAWLFVPMMIAAGLSILKKSNPLTIFVVVWLAGVLFVDVIGALWLSTYSHMPIKESLLSNLVFIPGDTIKALIVTIIGVRYSGIITNKKGR